MSRELAREDGDFSRLSRAAARFSAASGEMAKLAKQSRRALRNRWKGFLCC
jgi:hypothetical protein